MRFPALRWGRNDRWILFDQSEQRRGRVGEFLLFLFSPFPADLTHDTREAGGLKSAIRMGAAAAAVWILLAAAETRDSKPKVLFSAERILLQLAAQQCVCGNVRG